MTIKNVLSPEETRLVSSEQVLCKTFEQKTGTPKYGTKL